MSSSASSYTSEFNKRLLSTYICEYRNYHHLLLLTWAALVLDLTAESLLSGKVLGNLQLNLLSKSKVYEDSALSSIFLHNNYNYILKSLEKWVLFFLRPRPSRLTWIICVDELWNYGSPEGQVLCDLISFLSCVFWLENWWVLPDNPFKFLNNFSISENICKKQFQEKNMCEKEQTFYFFPS